MVHREKKSLRARCIEEDVEEADTEEILDAWLDVWRGSYTSRTQQKLSKRR